MTYRSYRLMLLHERVQRAISTELARATPSMLRLLRLRGLKLSIMRRLRRPAQATLAAA